MYKNTRTAEVMVDGKWIHIDPINIKKGMGFRMFEEDGTPVTTNGINSFILIAKNTPTSKRSESGR